MANNANSGGSAFGLPPTSSQGDMIQQLINLLVGDERLGNNIAQALSPIMNNALRGAIQTGAGSMRGGPSLMQGGLPGHAGLYAYREFNNAAVSDVMRGTQDAIHEAQRQQNENLHRFMGASKATAQAQSDDIFSITNLASKIAFTSHKPYALSLGMEETARYLGAGSSFNMSANMSQMQESINTQARDLTKGISTDFFKHMNKYGGLDGQEVGQVTAELARTGVINRNTGLDQATTAVRQMSKTVQSLKRFFDGDIADLVDQVNGLTGTNFTSTFGGQSANMLNSLSATGFAAGFTNSQMIGLANSSGQIARSMGMDPFSAIANAEDAATYLGVSRSSGDMRFINESRFRNTMTAQVTRANADQSTRAIAGAGALLLGPLSAGKDYSEEQLKEAEDFLSSVTSSGKAMSADDIAMKLNDITGGSYTGQDVINSSFTTGAQVLRAGGYGTDVSLTNRATRINNMRKATLRDLTGDRYSQVMESIGDGPLTQDNIQSALRGVYGEEQATIMTGQLVRGFEMDARKLELGNAAEADKFLLTVANTEERERLQKQAGISSQMQAITSEIGTLSGLRATGELIEKAKKGGLSFKEAWDTMTGTTNIDMTSEHFKKLTGRSGKEEEDTTTAIGMNTALSVRMTRMINGRQATEKELEQAAEMLDTTGKFDVENQRKMARTFARKHASSEVAQMETTRIASDMLRKEFGAEDPFTLKDKEGKSVVTDKEISEAKSRAEEIVSLDAAAVYEGKEGESFEKTRSAYRKAMMSHTGSLEEAQESFWSSRKEGEMGRKEFETELAKQKAIGEGGTAETNKLITDIINMLAPLLENAQKIM